MELSGSPTAVGTRGSGPALAAAAGARRGARNGLLASLMEVEGLRSMRPVSPWCRGQRRCRSGPRSRRPSWRRRATRRLRRPPRRQRLLRRRWRSCRWMHTEPVLGHGTWSARSTCRRHTNLESRTSSPLPGKRSGLVLKSNGLRWAGRACGEEMEWRVTGILRRRMSSDVAVPLMRRAACSPLVTMHSQKKGSTKSKTIRNRRTDSEEDGYGSRCLRSHGC